jgi:beta-lactamase class A
MNYNQRKKITHRFLHLKSDTSVQARPIAERWCRYHTMSWNRLVNAMTSYQYCRRLIATLSLAVCLVIPLAFFGTHVAAADSNYPDLRDSHDPALQKAMDKALGPSHPEFWSGVKKKEFGVVVTDVTDLHHPKVAWYNPNLMLYAASLPKIAIVLGVFVEIDRGVIELDAETRHQLIRMIRHSSNRDATALLNRVGYERLAEILQDERYGKLYDPAFGGGLWVGKAYGESPAWKRDPLHGLSHGASAMQAARFYYGLVTGTIIDAKYLPELEEIFGSPAINHKFVKGLKGRKDVEIYRKSGTWRTYHSDSAVIARDHLVYIVVYIDNHTDAGRAAVDGIRIIDDVMLQYARTTNERK